MATFIKHACAWLLLNTIFGILSGIFSAGTVESIKLLEHFLLHQILFHSVSIPTASIGYLTFYFFTGLYRQPLWVAILYANLVCLPGAIIVSASLGWLLDILQINSVFADRLQTVGWPLLLVTVTVLITPVITSLTTAIMHLQKRLIPIDKHQENHRKSLSNTELSNSSAQDYAGPVIFQFRCEDVQRLVPFDEINYLEASGHKSLVHTNLNVWLASGNLGLHLSALPANLFIRIHKSYIVNIQKISHIQYFLGGTYLAFLKDEEASCLRVGRSYVPVLKKALGLGAP